VLQKRLQEINPSAVIKSIPEIYDPESSASFHLEGYDYIIDAIDSLSNKAHLLVAASKTDAVTFSSMGAALKLDPQKIRVAEFWKVRGCKLGAALREKIRKGERTEKPILCVYSEEIQRNRGENALANANENGSFRKAQTNGTMVQVTAVFGFMLSSLVIQDIINKTNTIVTSSAISANFGYISVHSSFSPSAAAFRFSAVVPITPAGKVAVISNMPPSRYLNILFACSCSWLAVSWKIAAICSNPSFLACLAK
jgi:hypothetical protein